MFDWLLTLHKFLNDRFASPKKVTKKGKIKLTGLKLHF